MQLRFDQLDKHLQNELAPLYLVSGEVPLLMQEACDAIRKAATQHGFVEREILQIDTHFNWHTFITSTNSLSLFSNKQLLELRISNTLGETAGKALQNYLSKPDADKVILVITGKLESKIQQSTWFKTLNKTGVMLPIWPLETSQLPAWITQRLRKSELQADTAGIQLLAECAEGNLLACAQEIEKLKLTFGTGQLSTEAIANAISNSARFDVFNVVDATLQSQPKRIMHMLSSLKTEGIEPILVLWALARELRSLAAMARDLAVGTALAAPTLEKVLQNHRVWEKRKPLIRHALKNHSIQTLQKLLQQAQTIDCMIKGLKTGNVWDELESLCLAMAGISIHAK